MILKGRCTFIIKTCKGTSFLRDSWGKFLVYALNMMSFGRAWRCGNTWNSLHKRRLDCRWSIFWSLSRTIQEGTYHFSVATHLWRPCFYLSYLSCLSYLHVVWTNLTVIAFSIGLIVLSLWIVFFSILCVLSRITKSRTKPKERHEQGSFGSRGIGRISRELLVETCPGNFGKGNITSFTRMSHKPFKNLSRFASTMFLKNFPHQRRGKKVSLDDGIWLHCSVQALALVCLLSILVPNHLQESNSLLLPMPA